MTVASVLGKLAVGAISGTVRVGCIRGCEGLTGITGVAETSGVWVGLIDGTIVASNTSGIFVEYRSRGVLAKSSLSATSFPSVFCSGLTSLPSPGPTCGIGLVVNGVEEKDVVGGDIF